MTSLNQKEPKILFLSPRWVVVDKPAVWLTIPGRSGPEVPVLLDWVRKQHGPVWVVHRLDLETSGVVLFARSAQDHADANTWFGQRKVKKVYQCLAQGSVHAPFFKVSEPIEGQASSTQFEVNEKFKGFFLAKALPRTGRRHQIRIHLSQSGYPILGDSSYGGPRDVQTESGLMSVPRVALHAHVLELPSGEKFESPLPADFLEWLEILRKPTGGVSGV